jgi:hypothetical protein
MCVIVMVMVMVMVLVMIERQEHTWNLLANLRVTRSDSS